MPHLKWDRETLWGREGGGRQVRMWGRSECGAPAAVPTGGRWEGVDDRGGGARSGAVPGVVRFLRQ